MNKKKKTVFFSFVISVLILLIVCMGIVLKQFNRNKDENRDRDMSEDEYITDHFSEDCKSDYKYTAHNDTDVVYVDGTRLYRYSDGQIILDDVQIKKMIYSDMYLYVLDEKCVFYIVDMNTMNTYEAMNVTDVEYDGQNIYLSTDKGFGILCIDEASIIKDDKVTDFELMEKLEGKQNMDHYVYGDHGVYYYAGFDSHVGSNVVSTTVDNPEADAKWVDIKQSYHFANNNLSVKNGMVYVLCREYSASIKYSEEQNRIVCDVIYSLDFDANQASEVYKTENNRTRIVGFDSEKNAVYVYDVDKYQINELNLDTNQQTNICTLEKKYTSLIFEMSKDVLFVYTDNNELVQIVEL
ncbi:MAG: hypothetical protein Q4D54_07445 [Eubacteriales bacterium]|nr:hypothetical protein [Lachnospiraceae bacterium]MDO5127566.1 hypothetical protein [Eubacteriales bacterium]